MSLVHATCISPAGAAEVMIGGCSCCVKRRLMVEKCGCGPLVAGPGAEEVPMRCARCGASA